MGLRQGLPIKVNGAVLQVAGNEYHRLGVVAVREWNAGIRGTAGGGSNARHHLKRYALFHERGDLLAPAAEDERIAALEPYHALALFRQPHQKLVDVLLRDGMVVTLLAGIDTLGVAPHQLQHFGRHQAVVNHDVGLLHQAQRPEGEQVRVARPTPDQIDLPKRLRSPTRVREAFLQCLACRILLTGKHAFGD